MAGRMASAQMVSHRVTNPRAVCKSDPQALPSLLRKRGREGWGPAKAAPSMAEILFIKTSSLGDVVHHMPAITDARRHMPDARLAWVVEEDYAPLARLHPGIDEVIPVATRRWRKHLFTPATWREIGRFRATLQARSFAAAIDTQGLLRTALIAGAVRGIRHGFDRASMRVPFDTVANGTRMQSRAIAPCAALRSATRRSIRSTTGSTVPRSPARRLPGPMRR